MTSGDFIPKDSSVMESSNKIHMNSGCWSLTNILHPRLTIFDVPHHNILEASQVAKQCKCGSKWLFSNHQSTSKIWSHRYVAMNLIPSAGAMVGIDPPEQLDPQQDLEKLATECKDQCVSSLSTSLTILKKCSDKIRPFATCAWWHIRWNWYFKFDGMC